LAPILAAIEELPQMPSASRSVAVPPAPRAFLIVVDFLALFAEFWAKGFPLLCGRRDRFGADDSYTPALALIQDTEGTVFGGLTPVDWKS
jgi:hypothetical protein